MCKAVIKAIYKNNILIGYALIKYTPNGDDSFNDDDTIGCFVRIPDGFIY